MNENIFPEQVPFGTDSFADNPEPRCPCLLLDTSGSMSGKAIEELNAGLLAFKEELSADSLAMKRVEVAVISFGGAVKVENAFHTVPHFVPPHLVASGDTPMGAAIKQGLDLIRQRKVEYRENGISPYRPWVFLITDGEPTDEWQSAAALVREGEAAKSFLFFAVGVEGATFDILKQFSSERVPLKLQGLKFREMFRWLSNSMKSVSGSVVGTEVRLQDPAGWGKVSS